MKIGKKLHNLFGKSDYPKDTKKPQKPTTRQKVAYQASLLYTLGDRHFHPDTHQWWNPIKGTNITLGAIPLKNRDHHHRILNEALHSDKAQPKLAVLTLLEPFEINSKGPFSNPVTPKDWKKLGVTQKIIPAPDFKPLSQEDIKEAVHFLEKQDNQDIPTYVHCKAGRGRSAAATICFLMKKFQCSAEKAKKKVLQSRKQINLNKDQWKAIKTYEASLKT